MRRNWLVELASYEQLIQNIINPLNFNDVQQQLLQVKYKEKLEEDQKRTTDNWDDYFDKLKTTYEKEEESNYIDNLLKYSDKQSQDGNVAANIKYTQKKLPGPTSQTSLPISSEVLDLSKVRLTNYEVIGLKLELSFTQTPAQNTPDLEYDLYQFSRKLKITYIILTIIGKIIS